MKVFVSGKSGMVGSAVIRCMNALHPDWQIDAPTSRELDLRDAAKVRAWFASHPYDLVIHSAGKVGGIKANMAEPVEFLHDNMMIGLNVIQAAHENNVQNLIYLGSSCMYPRDFNDVLKEEDILAAPLEPTNEGYALAKVSCARQCEYMAREYKRNYRTIVPCNLYGPGDHFDALRSHLLAAIILKIDTALANGEKSVEIWGTGEARREFLFVDDLAEFIVRFSDKVETLPQYLNVGAGEDNTINFYYEAVASAMGYKGSFTHKLDAPVGMMRKLMDVTRMRALGWTPPTSLKEGIVKAVAYYNTQKQGKKAVAA